MDLKEETALQGDPENHWYYISKGRALRNMLDVDHVDRLLDVGAGSGAFPTAFIEGGFLNSAHLSSTPGPRLMTFSIIAAATH